jgi:hypothetical protein
VGRRGSEEPAVEVPAHSSYDCGIHFCQAL